ncbi:MAG: response regulator transcription factor [Rubrivivax sp.]
MSQLIEGPCASAAPPLLRRLALWSDDAAAAEGWRRALEAEGLAVDTAGAAQADAAAFHVSGGLAAQLARLRELRAAAPALPLVVACRGLRELDQVLALEMGADDVFDASLGAPVVAARLRALWRRGSAGGAAEPGELAFGALRLVLRERRVWWQGTPVPLSEGEFEVLWLLACQAGRVVTRREILRRVRGLDDHPLDRSIDCRVYRIRAKLGDGGRAAQRIRTVRHQGYAFSPVGW